ncbi:hypothetical protein GCM10010166_09110 [Couchioplanes caeruleus subsp. azureus]|nr:hypothetical protein GCM10010166_09110 [Couchioplanes caeruleus subsp. azureus]
MVRVIADADTMIVEVTVSGRWDRRLHQATARILRGCLAAHPAAIIMDLRDLGDSSGASATLWPGVRQWGQRVQPSVPVVACLPTKAPWALRCRGGRQAVPTYASVPDARAALINGRTTPGQAQPRLRLAPDLAEVAQARRLVTEACACWQPSELQTRARLVISELVVNAIEHAATSVEVAVTRLPAGVHLAVYDGEPRLPHLHRRSGTEPGDITERGLGLRAVDHAATAWGALPTHTGKMVWATITCHETCVRRSQR